MDWNFIDIHTHIIPGVDDGSSSMEASLGLIDMAYEEGIREMIATPHFGPINPEYDPQKARDNLNELQARASQKYPDIKLYMGNEIFLAPGYPDGLKDGMSCTLAGSNYVLVEFPMDISYDFIYHSFRKLMMEGYWPIFAHAERYSHALNSTKNISELVNMGVKIQVNSNSVLDRAPERSILSRMITPPTALENKQRLTHKLLKEGLVHFVSTDCHDMHGRYPLMMKVADKIVELVGEEKAREILIDNPRDIIQ